MPDSRQVEATLSIQREGDAGAFREVAQDLQGLSAPAQLATSDLQQLADAVAGFDAGGVEGTQQAVLDLISAIDRYKQAADPGEQLAALREVESTWQQVAVAVTEAGGAAESSLAGLASAIEEIRSKSREIAEPLEAAFVKAREAVDRFGQDAEAGLDGVGNRAAQARHALSAYVQELQRAKAEGRTIGQGEVARLRELEAAYDRATAKAGQFRRAQADAKRDIEAATRAAGEQTGRIHDLGDIVEQLGGKWATTAAKGIAVAGALRAGWEAGGQLREVLNDISNGGFDQFIQSLTDKLVPGASAIQQYSGQWAASQATINRQRDAFVAAGISLEKLTGDVTANNLVLRQHQAEVAAQSAAYEQWAASQGISKKALDDQVASLTRALATFQQANPNLFPTDLGEIFGQQIRKILDGYEQIRAQAPLAIRQIAEQWNILPTSQQQALERAETLTQQYLQKIGAATQKSQADLKAQTTALLAALSQIKLPELQLADPAAFQRAKTEVQGLVDAFRQAGQEIPSSLVQAADAVGVFVPAMERAGGVIPVFKGGLDQLVGSSQKVTVSVNAAGQAVYTISQAAQQSQGATAGAASGADRLASSLQAAGSAGQQGGAGLNQAATAAKNAAGPTEQAATATEGQAAAAQSAAEANQSAAAAAQGLASAAGQLEGSLAGAETSMSGLAESGPLAAEALQGVASAATEISRMNNFGAAIKAELDSIIAKAKEATAAVRSLVEADAA